MWNVCLSYLLTCNISIWISRIIAMYLFACKFFATILEEVKLFATILEEVKLCAPHPSIQYLQLLVKPVCYCGGVLYQNMGSLLSCLSPRSAGVRVRYASPSRVECPICLEPAIAASGEELVLQCGHMMHVTCAGRWAQHNRTCPLCRASTSVEWDAVPWANGWNPALYYLVNCSLLPRLSYVK